jgi:putative ABC transport system substrate-binding protein
MPVIGFLGYDLGAPAVAAFSQGLRELGYTEGRNIRIEYRWAEGKPERFAALTAKRATTTIPIVFGAVGNPVADGLVTSLARPGGNVTGLSTLTTELVGKYMELLKQAAPGVSLVALLLKPDSVPDSTREILLKEADVSERALGLQLQIVEALGPADFDRAFSDMFAKGAGALVVMSTPAFEIERQRIVDLAAKELAADGVLYQSLCRYRGLDVLCTELR